VTPCIRTTHTSDRHIRCPPAAEGEGPWNRSPSKPQPTSSVSSIRDGLLVGDNTVSPYDGDPQDGRTLPLKATQSSQINAEFVYRGSTIAPTNHITLPASTKEGRTADAVDDRVKTIHRMNVGEALDQARTLWESMLDASRS
jgi:hypothetical protein